MKRFALTQDGTTFVFDTKEDLDRVLGQFDREGVDAEREGCLGAVIKVHFIESIVAEWSEG